MVNLAVPLKRMVVTEKINPYSCTMCHENFALEKYFKKHMKTYHQRGGKDKCIHNRKSLKVGTTISNKEKISDTKESTFSAPSNTIYSQCYICSRRYKDDAALKVHLLTHTGEKQIKNHMQNIQNEKKFNCTHCSKTFMQKTNDQRKEAN